MARAYHARAAGVIGLMQQRARLSTARALVVLMPTILFLHAQARPVRSDDGFSAAASVRNEGFTPEGSFEDQFDQETGLDHDRWSTSGYWANSQPFNAGWDPAYWTNRDNTMILQLKRIPFQHQNWYLPFTSGGTCIAFFGSFLRFPYLRVYFSTRREKHYGRKNEPAPTARVRPRTPTR